MRGNPFLGLRRARLDAAEESPSRAATLLEERRVNDQAARRRASCAREQIRQV